MEFQTEYEWNMARKSPYQHRCGLIALALFGVVAIGAFVLAKNL